MTASCSVTSLRYISRACAAVCVSERDRTVQSEVALVKHALCDTDQAFKHSDGGTRCRKKIQHRSGQTHSKRYVELNKKKKKHSGILGNTLMQCTKQKNRHMGRRILSE
jgi:hypothetical protein